VHEKQIVVSRAAAGGRAAESRKFLPNRFQEAWELFVGWGPGE